MLDQTDCLLEWNGENCQKSFILALVRLLIQSFIETEQTQVGVLKYEETTHCTTGFEEWGSKGNQLQAAVLKVQMDLIQLNISTNDLDERTHEPYVDSISWEEVVSMLESVVAIHRDLKLCKLEEQTTRTLQEAHTKLGLFSLENRRLRRNLIAVFNWV